MSEFIRKTTKEDVKRLIENVRQIDIEEVDAFCGSTIAEVLRDTPDLENNSTVWEVDGKLLCIFGVTPLPDKMGIIWLLATDDFEEYTKRFANDCKRVFNDTIKGYEYLYNYVYAKNKKSIKWLEWLGFKIHDPEPIGREGANFHKFDMTNV